MKKIKLLLAALCAVGAWVNTYAVDWTDKTSLITNSSFETDAAISDLTKSDGSVKVAPTGWTVTYDTGSSNANTQQWGTANSSSKIQGIGSSHAPSDGDKYYYIRENWHGSTTYSVSQIISAGSIPAGFYRLSVKLANYGSSATDYTLSIQEGEGTEVKKLEKTTGNSDWQDWSVIAYKASDETTLTIKASMKGGSAGGSHWCLLLDNFKLEYLAASSVSSTNTVDITSCIVNPSFEWDSYNGTKDAASSIEQNAGGHKYATGWTFLIKQTGWSNVANVTNDPADGSQAYETWAGNPIEFKVYQTLSTLPEGVYEISASARTENSSADDICTYATVGGNTVYSDPFDVSDIKTPWNGSTNWQTLTARFSIVGSAAPEVGIHSTKFMQFDNFHLTYLGSDLLLSEATSTWTTAHTTLDGLDETLLPDAAETAITTELAKSCPSTLAEIEAATTALQALIDSYDGIKAAFDEYKALKAQVEDLENTSKYTFTGAEALSTFNSTLSTIDGNAEAATDAATITALLPSLKTAGNTFVGSIESNDGFDVTYNIVNNSFETGALSPWTTTGSNDTGVRENSNGTYTTTGVDGDYLFNTWNNGAGSKVSQTLSSLPNGYYTVTALVASDAGNTINILAGATTKTVNADGTGKTLFVEDTTDKTLVSEGSLEIGTNSSDWYKSDYFRLTYYTVKAGAAEAWAAAKAAAEAAVANHDYDNVTGSERTALTTEIAKAEPTTAEAYGTATTALQEATSAFIAAKDSYDAFAAAAAEATPDLTYAADAKKDAVGDAKNDTPTSAADAVTKTAAITTALRAYYESNAMAEGYAGAVNLTYLLTNYNNPSNTSGWTVNNTTGSSNMRIMNNESYTDADGTNNHSYFDSNSWGSAFTSTFTQDVELPAGTYILTAKARGNGTTTYQVVADGEATDISSIGNTGGVFGRGWNDYTVEFELDAKQTVTLGINMETGDSGNWLSFGDFRLYSLTSVTESVTVTDAGYATFCSPYALDFTGTDINAYIAITKGDGSGVTFAQKYKVPANTGILLYKDGGTASPVNVPVFNGTGADDVDGNKFVKGTDAAVVSTDGTNYNYVLYNGGSGLGFYKANNKVVASNKAYISVQEAPAGGVKEFIALPGMEDDATGLEAIDNGELTIDNAAIYNLAGQRLNKMQKGINIVNGKKILK